ncbi:glutamate racemase [Undibacterium sp. Jales W-56]|uniref:glutamate racemase n=1 Tax=Undibacterium sp. Jales W-56 TaxID=2897325 RepID=UPI0021CEE52D|nr:glutamate racemase [Undibacterium sp. Jales W-56]MCU6433589.1 glutamate racemase [Undibacterium sp. Jales W-56]
MQAIDDDGAVGVFDSGIGGLSVLRHIRQQLPDESLIYFADSGFSPYGDRSESFLIERSLVIAEFLRKQHCKAIVVACNSATAAAIKALRSAFPDLIIVGVEPGLKPAAQQSKNHIVGVLATQATLQSNKFQTLKNQLSGDTGTQFLPQACVGLADQIEKIELDSDATLNLLRRYLHPLLEQGIDTLVLGCTHYPFVADQIRQVIADSACPPVHIIDTGEAVARRLDKLIHAIPAIPKSVSRQMQRTRLTVFTSGQVVNVEQGIQGLLKLGAGEYQIFAAGETVLPISA